MFVFLELVFTLVFGFLVLVLVLVLGLLAYRGKERKNPETKKTSFCSFAVGVFLLVGS